MKKLYIPNGGSVIVSQFQAEFLASSAKFNASLKALFEPKTPTAPQPIDSGKPAMPAGQALPKHRIGEFRDRLSAPLLVIEA